MKWKGEEGFAFRDKVRGEDGGSGRLSGKSTHRYHLSAFRKHKWPMHLEEASSGMWLERRLTTELGDKFMVHFLNKQHKAEHW